MSRKNNYPDHDMTNTEVRVEIQARTSLRGSLKFLSELVSNKDLPDEVKDSVIQFLKEYILDQELRLYLLKKYQATHNFTNHLISTPYKSKIKL